VGKPGSGTTPAVDHDVREFLKNVIRRADAIQGNLAAHDRERWSAPLQGVRTAANRAFAECSKPEPGSATDGAAYVPVGATQR
jgi:hypothetical protein